jgi:hypothetical protein
MNSTAKMLVVILSSIPVLLSCPPANAQQSPAAVNLPVQTPGTTTGTQQPTGTSSSKLPPPQVWHFELAPYLWFAGAHGTVGAFGRDVSIHASPGDLLSHFDIGLMGAAEARYSRFVLNGDMMWIRISDSKALPFPNLGAVSADTRLGQLVWTSKGGYRVIDREKIKADATVGVRFWHEGQKLSFNPSALGLNFDGSLNWADFILGGRIQLPMGEKTAIDLGGDVGGWGASADLDYQFAILLGYKLTPKWKLVAGYRYLFIDYRPTNLSVINTVTSGALVGASYKFK